MNINNPRIAIVHDWFQKKSFGGAEKVTILIDEFLTNKYSIPDLFSLSSDIESSNKSFLKERLINTSLIEKLPFGKNKIQNYLPFLPFAIEQIDLRNYDMIVSSSHAFAKGVITSPNQLHISYIHTPMRYAWDQMNVYINHSNLTKYGLEIPLRYILYKLRQWDFTSAQRIDHLIANSNFTAKRIKKYWGLDADIIYPPVNIKKFNYKKNRGDFYLSVNRLVPNKRIDLLIKAFNKLSLPLIIIGDGPERSKLKNIAKSNIIFLNRASDLNVKDYLSRCRAFVYAGLEDFGIAPVEAMASGAPVIAFGKGGLLDTVNCLNNGDKKKITNGILFKEQTVSDVFDAVRWFDDNQIWKLFNPELLNYSTQKFSSENFNAKFEISLNIAWENFKKN